MEPTRPVGCEQNKTKKKVHTLKIRVTVLLFYLQGLIDWLVAGGQQIGEGRGGVEEGGRQPVFTE